MDMDFADVASSYRRFAEREILNAPVYVEWCLAVVESPAAQALIAELPVMKRQPNLVFAAARYFSGQYDDAAFRLDTADGSAFIDFLTAHWAEIRALAQSRSTQTNEAGRCAIHNLLYAEIDGPIALIEVGHSAGLTLIPDRYSYSYVDSAGVEVARVDPPDGRSAVVFRTELRGDLPTTFSLPTVSPHIVWRGGIDLNPFELNPDTALGQDQIRWMKALIWPGHEHRAQILADAAAMTDAVRQQGPWVSVTGDLLESLPDMVARAEAEAPGATVVVIHTAVIAYLPDPSLFESLMGSLGSRVRWQSFEGQKVLPRIQARMAEERQDVPAYAFVLSSDGEPVLQAHPWGYWADHIAPMTLEA